MQLQRPKFPSRVEDAVHELMQNGDLEVNIKFGHISTPAPQHQQHHHQQQHNEYNTPEPEHQYEHRHDEEDESEQVPQQQPEQQSEYSTQMPDNQPHENEQHQPDQKHNQPHEQEKQQPTSTEEPHHESTHSTAADGTATTAKPLLGSAAPAAKPQTEEELSSCVRYSLCGRKWRKALRESCLDN